MRICRLGRFHRSSHSAGHLVGSGGHQAHIVVEIQVYEIVALIVFWIDGRCSDKLTVVYLGYYQCDVAVLLRPQKRCKGYGEGLHGIVEIVGPDRALEDCGLAVFTAGRGRVGQYHVVILIFRNVHFVLIGP